MKRGISIVVCAAGIAVPALAAPAAAEPPEFLHGVGVCWSQVAIQPSLAGVEHLGQGMRQVARAGSAGSDVGDLLAALRGDGDGGCGAPPGPRHLR